ncbi:hypothetical protein SGLAD_v1c04980 [Spiroplasma gladiatoris]|uniref:Uncharacterized protein n=1 Tax=Spiroplasma gladiatoris TaxID=2143 RepID=A0A4P7AHK9_9MOLU|nr:hypothetical protein [Spiroplasma gladiatoris]QBQ07697.1 hypothetical protein SGLAD_v1c04980 [Spiroplasma gladiatoris]
MSKKKIFEYDENLKMNIDRIYFSNRFVNCNHESIAIDKRSNIFKCINEGCWFQLWFKSNADFLKFSHRVVLEFDFEKSEKSYIKKLRDNKKRIKKEKELKEKALKGKSLINISF